MTNKTFFAGKYFGTFILFLLFSIGVSAQDKQADAVKAATDVMKANLKLSDAQYAKVYAANTEFLKQAKVVRNSADDSSVKSQKQKELGTQRDAALKQILTADQYTTYLNNREQAKKDIKKVIEDRKKAESKRSGLKPAKQ
jgi:hypothetical protein